nr:hypothetical protein BaRGS_011676 [Batillaria attramentaria]
MYPPPAPPEIRSSNKAQFLSSGDTLTCIVSGGKPLVSSVHFSCSNPDHPDGPDDRNGCPDHPDGPDDRNGSSVSSSLTIDTSRATGADTPCVCSAVWEPEPLLYADRVEETYHLDCRLYAWLEKTPKRFMNMIPPTPTTKAFLSSATYSQHDVEKPLSTDVKPVVGLEKTKRGGSFMGNT